MPKHSMNNRGTFAAALLLLVSAAAGQLRYDLPATSAATPLKSIASPSWLDPQRFSMSHNFSFSVASGIGLPAGASSLSIYTNQMRYLVADNIVLTSHVHFVQPNIVSAQQLGTNPLQVYYQARMNWQLLRNFNIQVGFSNLPRRSRYSSLSGFGYLPYQTYSPGGGLNTAGQ